MIAILLIDVFRGVGRGLFRYGDGINRKSSGLIVCIDSSSLAGVVSLTLRHRYRNGAYSGRFGPDRVFRFLQIRAIGPCRVTENKIAT